MRNYSHIQEKETGFNAEQRQDILRIVQIALKDAELKKELDSIKERREINLYKLKMLPEIIVLFLFAIVLGVIIGAVLL